MALLGNKVALITGASKGIGCATAKKLAEDGAMVVLAARSEELLEKNVQEIVANGYKADFIACDVSDYQSVQNAVEHCLSAHGALDILVNNAGTIDPISRLSDSDPVAWGAAIDINVKGVYHGLRAALPVMEQRGGGTIINISSGAARSALEGWSHYCASKAAVYALTRCADKEYRDRGVRVIGLSPGTVSTDMMRSIKESGVNPVSQLDWSAHIPPEWPAKAIAFLCGAGGDEYLGDDFSIKSEEGRQKVGLA